MVDYMKEGLRLLNENIDLNAELVRCRLKLKQAETEAERLQTDMIDYRRGATYMTKQIQDRDEELTLLRKVADIAWNVVETRGMSDVLLSELAGRLADWKTWKEGFFFIITFPDKEGER